MSYYYEKRKNPPLLLTDDLLLNHYEAAKHQNFEDWLADFITTFLIDFPEMAKFLSCTKHRSAIIRSIKLEPYIIQHLKNPDDELLLLAIDRDPTIIEVIPSPSEKIQMAAVQKDHKAYIWISDPCISVQEYVFDHDQDLVLRNKSKITSPKIKTYITMIEN